MATETPTTHTVELTPAGLTPCCDRDPRELAAAGEAFVVDPASVTCKRNADTSAAG